MKIALLPGHAQSCEGAFLCAGPYKNVGENALAREYLPFLGEHLEDYGFEVVLTSRESAGGASPLYSAKAANASGADVALEWHFNSCGDSRVRGCEVVYFGNSSKGRLVANALSREFAKLLGVPNRGAKPVWGPKDRGWYAFKRSTKPFFMIEPCFGGSNAEDATLLGEAVASGLWPKESAAVVARIMNTFYRKGK